MSHSLYFSVILGEQTPSQLATISSLTADFSPVIAQEITLWRFLVPNQLSLALKLSICKSTAISSVFYV